MRGATGTNLLVVVSGTLGDALPIARVVDEVASSLRTVVITNSSYGSLFPKAAEVVPLPFDPTTVIASRAGQRMIEGGLLGIRRQAGLFGVVHPQIEPTIRAVAKHVPHASRLLVAGIPFGTSQLASLYDKPVLRILYQPHWPNWSVKSLYSNTSARWPKLANRSSHAVAELMAQLFFRKELETGLLRTVSDIPRSYRRELLSRLLHESYYRRHDTLLSFTESFGHEVLTSSPWASFTGFIRPSQLPVEAAYADALRRIEAIREPLLYCGFGSMVSRRTHRTRQAIAVAAAEVGLTVVSQGNEEPHLGAGAMHYVPFGDHRLLFPLCTGLVHHGGAGTVVASMEAGRPFVAAPQ